MTGLLCHQTRKWIGTHMADASNAAAIHSHRSERRSCDTRHNAVWNSNAVGSWFTTGIYHMQQIRLLRSAAQNMFINTNVMKRTLQLTELYQTKHHAKQRFLKIKNVWFITKKMFDKSTDYRQFAYTAE